MLKKRFCKSGWPGAAAPDVPGAAPRRLRPSGIAMIGNQAFSAINFRGPLIRQLVNQGHQVWVLTPDYDPHTRAAMRALGAEPVDYPLERSGVSPLQDLRSAAILWRQLLRLRPQVVLCYFVKPVIYGTLAAWAARVPRRVALIEGAGYAFAADAAASLRRRMLRAAVTALFRAALRRAHAVVVLNRDDHELFVSQDVVPAARVEILPGIGIDLTHYACAPPVTAPVTFCLAARLIEEKGIRIYAEAARLVRRAFPQSRFLLVGGIDDNPAALQRAEVESWVRDGVLEWAGWVEDVRPWLAQTSVFVLPSHYREGLPRSILEAMAMARPVITTDNPGCRDAVVDGECGFIVPVRDAARLAAAMRRFIEQPELIAELGMAARRRAQRLYDVHAINDRLTRLLLPQVG